MDGIDLLLEMNRTGPQGCGEISGRAWGWMREVHAAILSVYLSEAEQHSYRADKVIYNCLLADLFAESERPIKGSFENGWPKAIQQHVLDNWQKYGYK